MRNGRYPERLIPASVAVLVRYKSDGKWGAGQQNRALVS